MPKRILALLALLVACGAPADVDRPLYLQDGELVFGPAEAGIGLEPSPDSDLGTSRQGLVWAPAGATYPGIKPGSFAWCSVADPNQNCVVPNQKDLVWYNYGGTAAEQSLLRTEMNAAWSLLVQGGLPQCEANDCWHFREATDLADPEITLVVSVWSSATGVCSGPLDQTRDLMCFTGSTRSLPSPSVPGTYHTWAEGVTPVLTLDWGQISAKTGITSTQKTRQKRNALRAAILAFAGKGLVVIGNNRCNNTYWFDNTSCAYKASDVCFLKGFGDEGEDEVWIGGSDCGH